MNLHQNKPPTWLVHIPGHPWVLRQATGTLTHKTHHGPDSGDATTIPHIVYSATLRHTHIQVALFPGTPKLESQNPTKCPGSGLPGLWEVIAPRPDLGSRRGLNRSCSPRRDLSNDVSHSRIAHRALVDSRLLVVGSQTTSLTLGPSFAHNLGDRFRMANARPFSISTLQDLSNDTKNTPMRGVLGLVVELWTFGSLGGLQLLTFSKCWASPPHLAKVGLRHHSWSKAKHG